MPHSFVFILDGGALFIYTIHTPLHPPTFKLSTVSCFRLLHTHTHTHWLPAITLIFSLPFYFFIPYYRHPTDVLSSRFGCYLLPFYFLFDERFYSFFILILFHPIYITHTFTSVYYFFIYNHNLLFSLFLLKPEMSEITRYRS